MARAYTHRLLRASVGGDFPAYTVPAGMRAVVRNVDGYNGTAAAMNIGCHVAGYYICATALQAKAEYHLETRSVAYSGEQIVAFVATTGGTVVVTGYLFSESGLARRAPGDYEPDVGPPPAPLPWP